MYCPICGLEDIHANQFCRACGADLRTVRNALARPDGVTESAIVARVEIGRAVAARIRELESGYELKKVAEDVLPQIEKFLESPEQRRLRRLRRGTIVSSIGAGAVLMFLLMASNGANALFMIGLGLITFFIGLGIIINGLLFTVPKKSLSNKSTDAESQRRLDLINAPTNELPELNNTLTSVTEETTRHLEEKQPISRG